MKSYEGWKETEGVLIRKSFGSDQKLKLHVQYTVDGQTYVCKEFLKYQKHKAIKAGFLPIGYRSIPAIEIGEIGSKHIILYHPNKPKKSHIKGNDGSIT